MELFYHRVGQNVAGDAHHFGFGFRPVQAAVERELEILPLADLLQSLISHSLKSTLDGFSLGIQHALLERNVYVSFHGDVDIIRHLVTKLCQATDLAQKCELCVQVGQSVFQHLATAGVLGRLELLQHPFAGEAQALPLPLLGCLVWRKCLFHFGESRGCLRLLLLD
jgi:hypothetical protein